MVLVKKSLSLVSFYFDRPCQHLNTISSQNDTRKKLIQPFLYKISETLDNELAEKKVNKENYNKAVMSQNLLNCMNCFELGLSNYSKMWITNHLSYYKRKIVKNMYAKDIRNL